jgi:glucans biosynthesis protein
MGRGARRKFAINPLTPMDHSRARRLEARRCGARTPTGTPCQRPAIRGRKRCRLHGGLSPGAPRGQENGNFKTGNWTIEAIEERNWLRSLVRSFAKPTRTE